MKVLRSSGADRPLRLLAENVSSSSHKSATILREHVNAGPERSYLKTNV